MITVFDAIVSRLTLLDAAMFWIWVLAWLMFAVAAGGIAQGKGHKAGGYFLLGLLFSPVIGLTAALAATDSRAEALTALRARLEALERSGAADALPSSVESPASAPQPSGRAVAAAMEEGEAQGVLLSLVAQVLGWAVVIFVIGGGVWLFINQPR